MESQRSSPIRINLFSADDLLKITPSLPLPTPKSSNWNTTSLEIVKKALLPLLEDYLDPQISADSVRAFSEPRSPDSYSPDDFLNNGPTRMFSNFPAYFTILPFPDPEDKYTFSTAPIHFSFAAPHRQEDMSYETYNRRYKLNLSHKYYKKLSCRRGQKMLLSASQFFFLCDTPLLSSLCISKVEKTDRIDPHLWEAGSSPDQYIQDKCRRGRLSDAFGIQIQKRNIRSTVKGKRVETEYVLSTPTFCSAGRLSAFLRFTAGSKHIKKHMGSIVYHTRSLPQNLDQHNLKGTLSDEDAWFYEMCTGLSLTAEISALIYQLESEPSIPTNWNQHRHSVFLKILEQHREIIVSCPAVTWRFVVVRNIFRHINTYFTSPNTSREDNPPPSPTEEFEYYYESANKYFDFLLGTEIRQIDRALPSSFVKTDQESYSHGFINAAFCRFNQDILYAMELSTRQEIDSICIENADRFVTSLFSILRQPPQLSPNGQKLFSLILESYAGNKNDPPSVQKHFISILSETICEELTNWSNSFIDFKDTSTANTEYKTNLSKQLFSMLEDAPFALSDQEKQDLRNLCSETADCFFSKLSDIRKTYLYSVSPTDSIRFTKSIAKGLLSHLKRNHQLFYQKSSNYFRFCTHNHKNVERYLDREKNDTPLSYNSNPAPQSGLERLFQSVHDALYPDGYIEIEV